MKLFLTTAAISMITMSLPVLAADTTAVPQIVGPSGTVISVAICHDWEELETLRLTSWCKLGENPQWANTPKDQKTQAQINDCIEKKLTILHNTPCPY